jgi:hypothetical protein
MRLAASGRTRANRNREILCRLMDAYIRIRSRQFLAARLVDPASAASRGQLHINDLLTAASGGLVIRLPLS